MKESNVRKIFSESVELKTRLIESDYIDLLEKIGDIVFESISRGGKLMLCGNGGSAADAQHLAAEMLIRLRPEYNREAVPAISLAVDTSTITACGNDIGFESLYERMVSSIGKQGDCLLAISTSGESENILNAMKVASDMNIKVLGFLGGDGGRAYDMCDDAFVVPSNTTGRVQEVHITAGHALMEYVENRLVESGHLHLKK